MLHVQVCVYTTSRLLLFVPFAMKICVHTRSFIKIIFFPSFVRSFSLCSFFPRARALSLTLIRCTIRRQMNSKRFTQNGSVIKGQMLHLVSSSKNNDSGSRLSTLRCRRLFLITRICCVEERENEYIYILRYYSL